MFWIMGGASIFAGLASLTEWAPLQWWADQCEHVPWHGFKFFDMIFPLFLFIAGISFPFSLQKRISQNAARKDIYKHVIGRGLLLVIIGIAYNNGIRFDFQEMRFGSVLGRIGLAWMFAALIFMNTKRTYRIIWFCSLLVGYYLLLLLFPAHDLGSTDIFSREGNLASHIDRLLMPGRLYLGNHDPEGLFSTIPAIGTALLGMFTGEFLMSDFLGDKPIKKTLYLFGAAVALIIIGLIWNSFFPINKNLWTSSFVCFVGGLSLLLFSVFYLIIDVWGYRKWAFFFVVIGMNPITIYLTGRIINFNSAGMFFFKGFTDLLPHAWEPMMHGIAITSIGWVYLYILYRKKIFLKV
jgi:predicted acyltransferase